MTVRGQKAHAMAVGSGDVVPAGPGNELSEDVEKMISELTKNFSPEEKEAFLKDVEASKKGQNPENIDPLPGMIQQLVNDVNVFGSIFYNSAQRTNEKNKGLPPEQQQAYDAALLKDLIDAEGKAIQAVTAFRMEYRQAAMFEQSQVPVKKKNGCGFTAGMDFSKPAPKQAHKP